MNWFQRYGIPGASFWLFTLLLIPAFYECKMNDEMLKIIGPVALLTFLPLGYFIFIFQQLFHYWNSNNTKQGTISKSMELSRVIGGDIPTDELDAEIQECLMIANQVTEKQKVNDGTEKYKNPFEIIANWARKRRDVEAINKTIIFAIISSWLAVFIIPYLCFNWSFQCSCPMIFAAIMFSAFIIVICVKSTRNMRHQVIEVNKGLYAILAGKDLFEKIEPSDNKAPCTTRLKQGNT